MPVTIGAPPESGFDNPIGLITDCHRRIERFLAALLKLAEEHSDHPLSPEMAAALARALDYFRNAAPKHTADEEESLFPRLRAQQGAELSAAMTALDRLHEQHAVAEAAHAAIDEIGRRWLASGRIEAPAAAHLQERLRELSALYREHIQVEERDVFPLAAARLDSRERRQLGQEMAARRGTQYTERR